jgi:hypothetical protein
MSQDVYQRMRRESAALLRYEDPDNLSGEQATRLDCVVALRLVVDDMQSKLLRGESVDVGKLLAATQELSRLLPEPEERVITGESARQKLLETVLAVIAAEDAESSAAASQMESAAAALEGAGGAEELARLRAASEPIEPITPRECDIIEPSHFAIGGVPRAPDDPPPRSNVVIDLTPNPAPPPPAAPAPAYNYATQNEWRAYVLPSGEISKTPFGGGRTW